MEAKRTTDTKRPTLAYILLVLAMILWSLSYLVSNEALKTFTPTMLVATRMTMATVILGIIGRISGQLKRIHWRDSKYFLIAALCEPTLYFIFEASGLNTVSPTISSVILSLIPLFTPIFAFIFLRERLSAINIIGLVVSILGVMFVIYEKEQFSADLKGVMFLLLAVVSAIMYSIILRKVPIKYNTITIVFHMFLASIIYLIPLALVLNAPCTSIRAQFTWESISYAASLALFASCGAFLFYSYGIIKLGASKASAFNNIQPALTALFSFLIFGEILSSFKIFGIVLVIAGLFVSQIKTKNR